MFAMDCIYFKLNRTMSLLLLQRRNKVVAHKLQHHEFGNPSQVVNEVEEQIDSVKSNEVLVKILASPVNPADINIIEGKYSNKPHLPTIPGMEGVGEVLVVDPEVKNLKVGDHVVPLISNMGWWRTHGVFPAKFLMKIPTNLDLIQAATLTINPCTSYRMLKDFAELKPGNVVLQNGANSAVGQYVIQMARTMGLKTVNVVRNRPDIEDLKATLKDLGAHVVLTEDEIKSTKIFKTELSKPQLALNCVGGQSSIQILRHLQNGCSMITYGGMSKEPIQVPTSMLIFKDIRIVGFSVNQWHNQNFNSKKRFDMFNEIITMMSKNNIKAPSYNVIPFNNYRLALEKTLNPKGKENKFILKF